MMENIASASGATQDSSSLRQEDTVSLVKTIISSEFRNLKKQLLEKPTNTLKRKLEEEKSATFKYNGNQRQFDFNYSIINKLEHVKSILEVSSIEDIEAEIDKVVTDIQGRNKLIKIADRTEGGWTTVEEYEKCDYADDSDDDKKIRQANTRALQKKRRLQPRRSATVTSYDINRGNHLFRGQHRARAAGPLDICFRCGLGGHFRRDCRAQIALGLPQESRGSQLFQYPQSIAWGSAAIPTPQTGGTRKNN